MPDRDIIQERGRSLEDDYFRKKERELIEKLSKSDSFKAAPHSKSSKTKSGSPKAEESNIFENIKSMFS